MLTIQVGTNFQYQDGVYKVAAFRLLKLESGSWGVIVDLETIEGTPRTALMANVVANLYDNNELTVV